MDVSSMDEATRAAHIAGVTSNLHLAQAAAQALGDVPPILSAPNFLERGPDEKAVIIFVAFLCARVLAVSKEDRAAQLIQQWYRQRRTRQPGLQSFTLQAPPSPTLPPSPNPHSQAVSAYTCRAKETLQK